MTAAQRRILAATFLFCALASRDALADRIVLPAQGVDRGRRIVAVYALDRPATGKGILAVEWRDALHRLVARFRMPVVLADAAAVQFPLDLGRAVVTGNELRVRLSLAGRDSDAQLAFAVPPRGDPWRDAQIIQWQARSMPQYAALKTLGVTAAALSLADKDDPASLSPAPYTLLANDLGWYVENIATDFYSAYHRWAPDRPANWRFLEIKRIHAKDPLDPAAFIRDPSLSDARALRRIRDRLTRLVRAQGPYRPLFYDLADEPGVADLSAFWDFDFSPASLAGMRAWLRRRYGALAALNREWDAHFSRWDRVMPMTTAEAIADTQDNPAAWADFKEWMDEAFAQALRAGTDAVHAVDAGASAAIEGAQVPGWGGYDYQRLAHAVDVMELYDDGGNLEILRALNPAMVILTTLRVADPAWTRTLWRELLRGARGVILWDPDAALVADGGTLGPRAREMAGAFRDIRSGIGALLINSRRHTDPVAILYSPASMRRQWLIDWRSKGDAWAERDADTGGEENEARSSMMGAFGILERIGLHPRLISSEGLAHGALRRDVRVLVLPRAIALSTGEAATIRRFVAEGGIAIADGEPGIFDEHGRRRARPILHDLFRRPLGVDVAERSGLVPSLASCAMDRSGEACRPGARALERILAGHAVEAVIRIQTAGGGLAGDVSTYRFQNGDVTILGLQRDSAAPPVDAALALTLPRPAFVCDLRRREPLGRKRRLEIASDTEEASLFALAPAPLPRLSMTGPRQLRDGETAVFRLARPRGVGAAIDVVHIDVLDPSGRILPHYGGNLLARRGKAVLRLPLALDDPPGLWTIRASDLLGCATTTATLDVAPD